MYLFGSLRGNLVVSKVGVFDDFSSQRKLLASLMHGSGRKFENMERVAVLSSAIKCDKNQPPKIVGVSKRRGERHIQTF